MSDAFATFTFDDGLRCQYEHAYPVLRARGVPAVVFVPTGLVGAWYEGSPSMDLEQLRELQTAGWEIGSHTVSHPRLTKDGETCLSAGALEAELRESRNWLIRHGFRVTSLAYPAGRHNREIASVAGRFYRYARTADSGLNERASADTQLTSFNLCEGSVSRWSREVEEAVARHKWLIATAHVVVGRDEPIPWYGRSRTITTDGLAECVECAQTAMLPIRTFHEVAAACADLPARHPRSSAQRDASGEGVGEKVDIVIRSRGSKTRVAVRDERSGYLLRFRLASSDAAAIFAAIERRIAPDLGLGSDTIDQIAEFR